MKQIQYTKPAVRTVVLAESDALLIGMSNGTKADPTAEVEVKEDFATSSSYNVWDDDWSR